MVHEESWVLDCQDITLGSGIVIPAFFDDTLTKMNSFIVKILAG